MNFYCRSHANYDAARIRAFVCDITTFDCFKETEETSSDDDLVIRHGVADFLSMIFVLSGISPGDKQKQAIQNVSNVVKSGGIVFFRDYGRHDMAQLRFKGGKKIEDNFYARNDGTRAYYFTPDEVNTLFENAGFKTLQCDFVHRQTINIKEGVNVERTFVQGKFLKM